jgi:hypothetical protein
MSAQFEAPDNAKLFVIPAFTEAYTTFSAFSFPADIFMELPDAERHPGVRVGDVTVLFSGAAGVSFL